MALVLRIIVVGACCIGVAIAAVTWFVGSTPGGRATQAGVNQTNASALAVETNRDQAARDEKTLPSYPDPNAPGTGKRVFVDRRTFDDSIFILGASFTGPIADDRSIAQSSEAVRSRGARGIAELRSRIDRLRTDSPPTEEQAKRAYDLWKSLALIYLYEGRYSEAATWFERALSLNQNPGLSMSQRTDLRAMLGLLFLRVGETENCVACVGPSSCIFPIARAGIHKNQEGSREAIKQFLAYLEERPGDVRMRWLLNLAYMTLGEYPEKVPPQYLIPLDRFRSKVDAGRFFNVAPLVGLNGRGTNQAGGSIFDDFNGDGLPDILATSIDPDDGASLFINGGNGKFEDRTGASGLASQTYALNVARADFDNDGNLDVLLLRGGWEKPARLSLMRNKGNGIFEDVTVASGLDEPIATESAAWGDYDNDGLIDLFVCGEYFGVSDGIASASAQPDDRNRCRLYHNLGNGKFVDVAAQANVRNEHCAKGAVWGDYDNDGRLDLYVSNMYGPVPARLYRNEGNGTFRDMAADLGITGHPKSFAALFWDYDNDGWLDLFVLNFRASLAEVVASYMDLPVDSDLRPRLYHNENGKSFREVSREVGLDRPISAMSVNCGDIDNDGFLDLHLGTGWMSYSGLIPDLTFLNVGGRRFEDVTDSTGTGHLQKGHGISFADWDCDGDLDFFEVPAGGMPGDKGYNVLFQNPGSGRHWLKIKLVGTKTNRAAIGARIQVDLQGPDGKMRSIHRMVGTNGSFGGNSLVEFVGLLDVRSASRIVVSWPASKSTQTFRDVPGDQEIVITEGNDSFKSVHRPALPSPKLPDVHAPAPGLAAFWPRWHPARSLNSPEVPAPSRAAWRSN